MTSLGTFCSAQLKSVPATSATHIFLAVSNLNSTVAESALSSWVAAVA